MSTVVGAGGCVLFDVGVEFLLLFPALCGRCPFSEATPKNLPDTAHPMLDAPAMNDPKLVVFDLAGTTVEDRGEVPAAFTAALAEEGIVVTPEQVIAVRGASKRQAVLNLMPEGPDRAARVERVYASFQQHLAGRYAQGVKAIAGAEETFAWLRGRGIKIALNTGFDREITDLLLAALGWTKGQVDAVVCGDEVRQGRPAPQLIFRCLEATGTLSVQEVAVVGDTTLDLQSGHNAGTRWNVGVLSGAHTREQLAQQPHTHLLASVADLPAIWDESSTSAYVASDAELAEETFEWGTLKWLCNERLSPGAAQTIGICHIHPGRRNPVHYHPNCEEVLYLLAGEGEHRLDDRLVKITAGATIRIPAGVRHNLGNTGSETITCLIAFSSGRRETVFLE
jgi:phosphonatase-like hydrolase